MASIPAPITPQTALRDRLPKLHRSATRLSNALYAPHSAVAIEAWDRKLEWRWTQPRATRGTDESVQIAAGSTTAWIAIEADRGFCPDLSLDWQNREGHARLLAWTLTYEPVMAHVRKVFGLQFVPVGLGRTQSAPCTLGFAVWSGTGEELLAGTVGVDPDTVAVTAEGPPPDLAIPSAADAAPIGFRVVLGSIQVSFVEARALSIGDVLVVGSVSRIREGARLRLEARQASVAMTVRLGPSGARVESIETAFARNGRTSMQPQVDPVSAAKDGGTNPIDVERLPVMMSFDAGEVALTVRELRTLGRGSVVPLGRELADSPITIRVNGVTFAKGELVLVDDVLAIRIIELHARGSD